MGPKTYKWMREHSRYDDEHPKIALEVMKRYATTERVHTKVMLAAKRSLQLLNLALHTSYRAYSVSDVPIDVPNDNRRARAPQEAARDRLPGAPLRRAQGPAQVRRLISHRAEDQNAPLPAGRFFADRRV